MNDLPAIFIAPRRAPAPTAVAQSFFAEFVQASRARAKREAEDFLAARYSKAQARAFLPEAVPPTGFGELGRVTK